MDSARVASHQVPIWEAVQTFEAAQAGSAAYEIVKTLYPICRSITGNGIRESLRVLGETIPLRIHEVQTGTQVFDWTVPNEWNIRDAYIKNAHGERIVDFQRHNLHVLNYSVPVQRKMSLAELRPHLFSAPDAPDWIPYRTSYYREAWGFCLSHKQLEAMPDGEYEVCIDSTLGPGHLSYGDYRIPGATEDEVLISCHSCHPSLCNDNLSGMTVAAELAKVLDRVVLHHSYRFIWIPGTIGAITWLAQHEALLPNIRHGLVLSCVGDSGSFTYKRSRQGSAQIDRAVEHVLKQRDSNARIREFIPYGYDERQYCSPGINLPVGCFMRTPNGEYPEYHSSADDLTLVSSAALGESVERLLEIVQVLEENRRWMNLAPKCEPQLGRRGLYRQTGGLKSAGASEMTILWLLNYSDGHHDLLDIATRAGIPFSQVATAARALQAAGILNPIQE